MYFTGRSDLPYVSWINRLHASTPPRSVNCKQTLKKICGYVELRDLRDAGVACPVIFIPIIDGHGDV